MYQEILHLQVHRQRAAARRQGFIGVPFLFPLGRVMHVPNIYPPDAAVASSTIV